MCTQYNIRVSLDEESILHIACRIDGSGAFFCLFVNDSSFFHVMRHIGDVYTYFPQSFFQFADRKCIVEVFGIFRVNSESGNFAEVLTFGNLFG